MDLGKLKKIWGPSCAGVKAASREPGSPRRPVITKVGRYGFRLRHQPRAVLRARHTWVRRNAPDPNELLYRSFAGKLGGRKAEIFALAIFYFGLEGFRGMGVIRIPRWLMNFYNCAPPFRK